MFNYHLEDKSDTNQVDELLEEITSVALIKENKINSSLKSIQNDLTGELSRSLSFTLRSSLRSRLRPSCCKRIGR
jgi:hypothetical protein